MNYSCESFMDFCDQMMIVEEKLDVSVLDGFGGGNMVLYHASPLKLDIINPTSWNMGNRLSPKKRKSSFWTTSMEYSILWSLDWVMLRIEGLPYIHDIDRRKFYVPEGNISKNIGGIVTKIPILNWIERQIKDQPVYIYEAEIPRVIVSKGQFNIDEYTVDIPITPKKMHVVTSKDAMKIVEVLPCDKFEALVKTKIGDTRKRYPTFKERLIYRNPNKVIRERTRRYKKEYASYGHNNTQPAYESLFD